MKKIQSTQEQYRNKRKTVLELPHTEARKFFLKQESYCNQDMPPYITFQPLIDAVNNILSRTALDSCEDSSKKPCNFDDVNYTILNNKDGKFSWRPIQLIHPALYVALVHKITEKENWMYIISRFKKFSENENIRCLSIPVLSLSGQKDKAEQITKWWKEIEQKSFELSLDFEYLIDIDLTDCYGSIYTHSIAWALHGKPDAKANRTDKTLVGNVIDEYIRDMRYGQTNGIPQGSVLMDFIAEMILGYADRKLSQKLKGKLESEKYCILRYRDDYRIFVQNAQTGESIVKHLTETMIGLGLRLNPTKTKTSNEIVHSAMKNDKLHWIEKQIELLPDYKSLLIIHEHARLHPNSGSLCRALDDYKILIENSKKDKYFTPLPLVGIIVDIAYRNPKTFPVCATILSVLLQSFSVCERQDIVEKIRKKFELIPNTGYMEIWLQRVTLSSKTRTHQFLETICRLVAGEKETLWNCDWIASKQLKRAFSVNSIVDQKKLEECMRRPYIFSEETALYLKNLESHS